jgi:hypothetical protein
LYDPIILKYQKPALSSKGMESFRRSIPIYLA